MFCDIILVDVGVNCYFVIYTFTAIAQQIIPLRKHKGCHFKNLFILGNNELGN